jgi:hypothetical protein
MCCFKKKMRASYIAALCMATIGIVIAILGALFAAGVIRLPPSTPPSRILLLVMFSAGFEDMVAVTRRYYHTLPDVDVVYYTYQPGQSKAVLQQGDVLSFQGQDSFIPGCLKKTMLALAHFAPVLHRYQYILRANVSTIVDVPRLRSALSTATATVHYGAARTYDLYAGYRDPAMGIVDDRFLGLTYGAGLCLIMSPRSVRALLQADARGSLDYSAVDDVAIGAVLVPLSACSNFHPRLWVVPDFQGNDTALSTHVRNNLDSVLFYRNKHPDRRLDVHQMRVIVNALIFDASLADVRRGQR